MDEEEVKIEDRIIHSLKNLANSKKGVKFSLTISIVSFILHTICYSTNGWIVNGSARLGLWTFCNTSTYECCQSPEKLVEDMDWLHNSRSCMSFGLVLGLVSVLCIILHSCVMEDPAHKELVRKISFITNFSVTLVKITGVGIYGTRYKKEPFLVDFGPSLPFIGSIMSGALFFASGIVLLFEHTGNEVSNDDGIPENDDSNVHDEQNEAQPNRRTGEPPPGYNYDVEFKEDKTVTKYFSKQEHTSTRIKVKEAKTDDRMKDKETDEKFS